MEGAAACLGFGRNSNGRSKVVGLGRCIKSSKLNGFVSVECLDMGIYRVCRRLYEDVSVALVSRAVMTQFRD